MIALLSMLACAPAPDDLPCRDAFTRAEDGHCYPDESIEGPSSLAEIYELMAPCTGLRPGDRLDLESGCAGDFCEGDLYDIAALVLGEPTECFASGGDAYCTWPTGLGGRWDDDDGDGFPDVGSRNQRVKVADPWVYGSTTGLGIWMPPSCFVDALGHPDDLTLVEAEDGVYVERINFDAVGLIAYDLADLDGRAGPDGLIEQLYLYGAP